MESFARRSALGIRPVAALLLALLAFPARGAEAGAVPAPQPGLREFFPAVSDEVRFIVACPDVPAFRRHLQDVGLEALLEIALRRGNPDAGEFYRALSGRLLFGLMDPENMRACCADIAPESEFAKKIARGEAFGGTLKPLGNGLFEATHADQTTAGFVFFDGRTLRFARTRDLARAPAEAPGEKLTDSAVFTALLQRFATDRGLLLFLPDVRRLIAPLDERGDHPSGDMMRIVTKAILAAAGVEDVGAVGARLEVGDGFFLDVMVTAKDLAPAAAPPLAAEGWPQPPVGMLSGRAEWIAGLVPAIRRGQAALGEEELAEFNEELAEANRDLDFDFEKDFLGNLTGEWSLGRWDDARWALRFRVKDPAAFLAHARKLAEVGAGEWAPDAAAPAGETLVRTRAYRASLALRVRGDVVTLSGEREPSSAGQGQAARAPAFITDRPEGEVETLRAWYAVGREPVLRKELQEKRPQLGFLLAMLPPDTTVWLSVSEGKGYRRVRLCTGGLTREDLRAICTRLAGGLLPGRAPD